MKNYKDKVVVITGAGSGIGRALALEFGSKEARLALNDYKSENLSRTIELLPKYVDVYDRIFDVSDRKEMYSFAAGVMNRYGRVDIVINNAGVALAHFTADEISWEQYEWIFGINLWGMMYGSLAFLPYLRRNDEASLVNISSIFGLHGIPGQAGYSTTKFGIRGFTESLAMEESLKGSSVKVSSVHPGGIKTNIARNALGAPKNEAEIKRFEEDFITTPEKAAKTIVRGIKNKKLRIVVGPDGKLFYFLTKMPGFILRRFIRNWYRKVTQT